MKSEQGFSLIELLAATVIFGVLLTVVLTPLANLFRNTGSSTRTLQTTTQAQQVLEAVKGQWRAPPTPSTTDATVRDDNDAARDAARTNYDLSCYPGVTVPATATVIIRPVDRNGVAGAPLNCSASMPALSNIPVMKRITVTVRSNDSETVLSVDVPRPPANDPTPF